MRGTSGYGRFIVYGAGKKRGETVDLHPELRTLVDEVLSTGYLAEAEAAFQRGEVEDYFLFPAGKLKGGSPDTESTEFSRAARLVSSSILHREMSRSVVRRQHHNLYSVNSVDSV